VIMESCTRLRPRVVSVVLNRPRATMVTRVDHSPDESQQFRRSRSQTMQCQYAEPEGGKYRSQPR
jgi:hypothetical protein